MRRAARLAENAIALALLLGACNRPGAQAAPWRPSAGHREVPVWPGSPPDAPPAAARDDEKALSLGKVSQPTMTFYAPTGRNTGAAMVVFPGGGYWALAMGLEGTEVCDWLTSRGIACILLKYRVPGDGLKPRSGPYPFSLMALEDAQRTLGLVRLHAAGWHIDPHKIGVLGFSAGGHLVAAISTHFDKRLYRPVDPADRESCRPDFAVALYPGHLTRTSVDWDAKQFGTQVSIRTPEQKAMAAQGLNPDLPVTPRTPPTFLLQADNDPVDDPAGSALYYLALNRVGVPAELHLYAKGGHAFGLRRTGNPITGWPVLVENWLLAIGVLPR